MRALLALFLAIAGNLPLCASAASGAEKDVDLALVLAVDVSHSMDTTEQRFQRAGYVSAFRSPELVRAIQAGAIGRIAVTYVEWSGPSDQFVVAPWTVIGDTTSAFDFSSVLARAPINRRNYTSISEALSFSVRLLGSREGSAVRQAIDISGDGPNNVGEALLSARAKVLAKGITINGLPIILANRPRGSVFPDLDQYYKSCVIGGPNAFEVSVRSPSEFARATRRKLILEISSAPVPNSFRDNFVIRTAEAAYDCAASEGQEFLQP